MKHLVVGRGEIGKAVVELLGTKYKSIYTYDLKGGYSNSLHSPVDTMHICFPYSDKFVGQVTKYIKKHEPEHVIIWSTVAIGTTKKIKGAIHSPVEGRHPLLFESVKAMRRWVGANDPQEARFWDAFFRKLGLKTRVVDSSDYTEALKLLSTSEYGLNLVFADYKDRVCQGISMDYDLTKKWNEDYNHLYQTVIQSGRFQKFVLDAPKGVIGGHCVRENAALLQESFDDDSLDMILEMKGTNGW